MTQVRPPIREHDGERPDITPPSIGRPFTAHEALQNAIKDEEARKRMRREQYAAKNPVTIAQKRLSQVVLGLVVVAILYTAERKASKSGNRPNILEVSEDITPTTTPPLLAPTNPVSMSGHGEVGPLEIMPKLTMEAPSPEPIMWVDNQHPISQKQIESDIEPNLVMILNTDPIIRLVREHEKVDKKIVPDLYNMVADSQKDGKTLFIRSAFRTIEEQSTIDSPSNYVALPGSSHHQLGTAIDWTTPSIGNQVASYAHFENTPEGKWLVENAYKYGFVLPFNQPENPDGISYEPWHLTWVGKKAALLVHDSQLVDPTLSVQTILGQELQYPSDLNFGQRP